MALGTVLAGKLSAVVTYVKARVDIKLDYDSKNSNPTDSVSLDDNVQVDFTIGKFFTDLISLVSAPSMGMTKLFTDTIGTADAIANTITVNIANSINVRDAVYQYSDGMLNTSVLNNRVMHGGNTTTRLDNVSIIIT